MDTASRPPGRELPAPPHPAERPRIFGSPYTQLIVVNMMLAVMAVTLCFGAPADPAIIGALSAGGLLYWRRRRCLTRGGCADPTGRSSTDN